MQEHIHDSHENICDHATEKGKELCVAWGLSMTRRQIRRKKQIDEAASHIELSYEREIRRVMKATLDGLVMEVNGQFSRLRDLESRFGFLLRVNHIVFASMEDDELGLQEKCNDFARCFANESDGIELYKKIKDYQMLFRRSGTNIAEPRSPVYLFHLIISCGDDVFPNLRISP